MGKRQIGSGIVAVVALLVAWLLPVTFPSLSGWSLILAWTGVAVALALGLHLIWHEPSAPTTPKKAWKSLREFFDTDFPHLMKYGVDFDWTSRDDATGKGRVQWLMDFDANIDFMSLYFPMQADEAVIRGSASEIRGLREKLAGELEVTALYPGDSRGISNRHIGFSKRVFVYHEINLEPRQIADLIDAYREHDLELQLRGHAYAMSRNLGEASRPSPA